MSSNSMASAHVILKYNSKILRLAVSFEEKVVPHDSKSDLPQVQGQIADILSNALFLFSWFSNNQSIEVGKYIHYQIIYLLWKVQRI